MSLSHNEKSSQGGFGSTERDGIDGSEEYKAEPPDSAYHHHHSFGSDPFAINSLELAASAIMAVQQQQVPSDLGTSFHNEGTGRNSSPSTLARTSSNAALSRSSSAGRPSQSAVAGEKGATHPERHMWTQQETQALVDGCNKHGIGNWKAILNDEDFVGGFNGRTPGDLKDRFRTYFPDAYHELYPNAKTHTSRAVRSKAPDGTSIFEKGKTKERRPFTPAEDEVLKRGYEQHGSHWAKIAKDSVFEGRRKSTDLRDRFRNAFPTLYEQAGYKPRTKMPKKERRQSSSGSFSHHEPAPTTNLPADWHVDAMLQQRPELQARSDTSTSVHSQAVSEHSDHSDEDDFSDAVERSHSKDRSGSSFRSNVGLSGHHQQTLQTPLVSANSSNLERSTSRGSSTSDLPVQQKSEVGISTIPTQIASAHPSQKPPQPLRRSQSTKRANCKVVGSIDHVVKTAFNKSSKEAIIASHQQAHMQHLIPQQLQQQRTPLQDASGSQQRPQFNQSMSAGWLPRFGWLSNNSADSPNLANMDLDQMDELMNSHSASELLRSSGSNVDGATIPPDPPQRTAVEGVEAMNLDGDTNQADFASIYQQLAMASNNSTVNRALSIESFQDLLDPLSNNQGVTTGWDQNSGNLPWTPVSSAAAAMTSSSTPAHASTSATRREHEHNQWAGDLLHRGTFNELQSPQGFVSMASMHLSNDEQGIPPSRSADEDLGQQQRSNDFAFVRPTPPSGESNQTSMDRPFQRFTEQLYTTPSVNELISRSTRRQSYPPRPFGWGEDGNGGEEMMQAAYSNPYPYPADDISLLNSSGGGSLTLFPSLVNNQGNDYNHIGMMRRRRSTDTLREGAFSFPQSWRSGLMDNNRQVEEEEQLGKENIVAEKQRETVSSSSLHGNSDHSRSVSDVHTNDDDEDAPSRAASVGNLDLTGNRDNVLYAESLPDLSSGMGGHNSSTASESAFSHHHNLQISYDDMDLPSFLNRSPNFLHATTAAATTNFSSGKWLNDVGGLRTNNRAWSASGISEAGKEEEDISQRQVVPVESSRGISKSVDLTSSNYSNTGSNQIGQYPFSPSWMNDAGALDRLEHLYLEGLHTPSSPLYSGQGLTGGLAYNQQGSSSAIPSSSTLITGQRMPANNSTWWSSNSNNERGAGGSEGGGGGGGDDASG